MKSGGGKGKGSSFEREVGYSLSLWLSCGQRKDLICRTVLSGGQFTVGGKGNQGDLMAQHPLAFKFFECFSVECKHWKNLEMVRFLVRDGDLYKALKKVKKQAEHENKLWMLIARQNFQKTILFMPAEAMVYFFKQISGLSYHVLFSGNVYMFYFSEFLSKASPELDIQITSVDKISYIGTDGASHDLVPEKGFTI